MFSAEYCIRVVGRWLLLAWPRLYSFQKVDTVQHFGEDVQLSHSLSPKQRLPSTRPMEAIMASKQVLPAAAVVLLAQGSALAVDGIDPTPPSAASPVCALLLVHWWLDCLYARLHGHVGLLPRLRRTAMIVALATRCRRPASSWTSASIYPVAFSSRP